MKGKILKLIEKKGNKSDLKKKEKMKSLVAAGIIGLSLANSGKKDVQNFIYRDDIGAFWGIKGYEELVTEVGTHKGHSYWP